MICIQAHNLHKLISLIMIQFQSLDIQFMPQNVSLDFLKGLQIMKLSQGFSKPSKMVINGELTSEEGHRLEILKEGKIFPRVL